MNTKIAKGQTLDALQRDIDTYVADGYHAAGNVTRTDDEYTLVMQLDDEEPLYVRYTADGAIDPAARTAVLAKATAGAFTLGAGQYNGQRLRLVQETMVAHVVASPDKVVYYLGGAVNLDSITFTNTNREVIDLEWQNGLWYMASTGGGYTVA